MSGDETIGVNINSLTGRLTFPTVKEASLNAMAVALLMRGLDASEGSVNRKMIEVVAEGIEAALLVVEARRHMHSL